MKNSGHRLDPWKNPSCRQNEPRKLLAPKLPVYAWILRVASGRRIATPVPSFCLLRRREMVKVELGKGLFADWESVMCDYSLHNVKSRPANIGDKLTTRDFGTGTRGFAAAEDANVAVCIRPGTELSFASAVTCLPTGLFAWRGMTIKHNTAIFRQVNKDKAAAHHDALEFPDGRIVLLTVLEEGQQATVLQLPADPKTAVEADAQQQAAYAG